MYVAIGWKCGSFGWMKIWKKSQNYAILEAVGLLGVHSRYAQMNISVAIRQLSPLDPSLYALCF